MTMLPKVIHTKNKLREVIPSPAVALYPDPFCALREPALSFRVCPSRVSVCPGAPVHRRFLIPPSPCHVSSVLHTHFKASYFLVFASRWWTEKEKEESQRWETELEVTIPQTASITFAVFTTSSCYVG